MPTDTHLKSQARPVTLVERVVFRAPLGTAQRLEQIAMAQGLTATQLARRFVLQGLEHAA